MRFNIDYIYGGCGSGTSSSYSWNVAEKRATESDGMHASGTMQLSCNDSNPELTLRNKAIQYALPYIRPYDSVYINGILSENPTTGTFLSTSTSKTPIYNCRTQEFLGYEEDGIKGCYNSTISQELQDRAALLAAQQREFLQRETQARTSLETTCTKGNSIPAPLGAKFLGCGEGYTWIPAPVTDFFNTGDCVCNSYLQTPEGQAAIEKKKQEALQKELIPGSESVGQILKMLPYIILAFIIINLIGAFRK